MLSTSLLPHCQYVNLLTFSTSPPLPLLTIHFIISLSMLPFPSHQPAFTTRQGTKAAAAEHHHHFTTHHPFPSPQASPTLHFPRSHSTLFLLLHRSMGGAVHQEDEAGTPPALVAPAVVVKGKRSKRQRVHAPPFVLTAPPAAEWSSSAASATAVAPAGDEDSGSTSRSADEAASTGCVTEEEEDMALCLMMLSRGEPAKAVKDGEVVVKEARFRSRRPAADGAAAGEFVYECKTCNKCFPSFQALGGHRTSHKKPRLLPPSEADKNPAAATVETATTAPSSLPPSPPPPLAQESSTTDATVLAIPVPVVPKQEPGAAAAVAIITSVAATTSSSKHPRVHECSICGAEFASGQALGGHMRRHRPLVPAAAAVARDDGAPRKEKSLLELDLNMPAPCDEADTSNSSPRFAFAERQPAPALLFPAAAASALVDCHY